MNEDSGGTAKKGGTRNLHLDSDKWLEIDTFVESKCFWNMPATTGEQYLDGESGNVEHPQ